MKRVGIFLGRMQPFHEGHRLLLEKILEENQEIVVCIGSAQLIRPGDRKADNNPLTIDERIDRVRHFLASKKTAKEWRIVAIEDIDDDHAWPEYLAKKIGLRNETDIISTLYFGEKISDAYMQGLRDVGIQAKILKRKKFKHRAPDEREYVFSNATEIRELYRRMGAYERI